MFFDGNDKVHLTLRRVAAALDSAGISYAIVGGMAVNAHEHERTTKDVDFLVTSQGFETFEKLIVSGDFSNVPGRSRRFLDRITGVTFDFIVSGMYPGSGKPGPIVYPNPKDVSQRINNFPVIDLATLIQLKLAARRHQDYADVVNLISAHQLDESYLSRLHPSVHADYVECLEEKRREDEYELRRDEQFRDRTGDSPDASS